MSSGVRTTTDSFDRVARTSDAEGTDTGPVTSSGTLNVFSNESYSSGSLCGRTSGLWARPVSSTKLRNERVNVPPSRLLLNAIQRELLDQECHDSENSLLIGNLAYVPFSRSIKYKSLDGWKAGKQP